MTKFYYSVLKIVPDLIRGEYLNVGVALASTDDAIFLSRFQQKAEWRTLRRLNGGVDYGVIAALADGMAKSRRPGASGALFGEPLWTVAKLESASREWSNMVQLSEPRPIVGDQAAELLDTLFTQYVGRTAAAKPAVRDKQWLKNHVTKLLLKNLEPPPEAPIDWPELVPSPQSVPGARETHQFDLAIRNGRLQHVFDLVSFEIQTKDQLRDSLGAKKWAIADTHEADKNLPISVLVIGEGTAPKLFGDAQRIYKALGAEVVTEATMESHLLAAARKAISDSRHTNY